MLYLMGICFEGQKGMGRNPFVNHGKLAGYHTFAFNAKCEETVTQFPADFMYDDKFA